MGKFKLSAKAKVDVNNIWEYTFAKWSLNQADKYFNGLQKQFRKISKNPGLGKNYENVRDNYFGSEFKSHIIFYKVVSPNEIEIIRVLHERMDLPKRLIE